MNSSFDRMLENFQKGDEDAFRYYYEMYYHPLCLFGFRMLNVEEEVKDIVQDVFVNLWKAQGTIESVLHMKMYLYQSMRHRCLNYIRLKKKEEIYGNEYELLNSNKRFENAVIEEEVHRLIIEEINNLPQKQRRVIFLHLEGKNNIEIAEIMNLSVNTVKTHKDRARQQLKVKLQDFFLMTFILRI